MVKHLIVVISIALACVLVVRLHIVGPQWVLGLATGWFLRSMWARENKGENNG